MSALDVTRHREQRLRTHNLIVAGNTGGHKRIVATENHMMFLWQLIKLELGLR
ncbi:hypothetical protein [Desulfocurvibacter africanus]|uniref:hypothetical protein n=1 Tax=Desulfocurvibacter africanus TaxID=873 RepID=UPI0002E6B6D8|nr:hypothetical protein [Desulfocurvibacter africanus]